VANLAICNIMEYVYTKELKARTWADIYTLIFKVVLFTIAER
jgi:hypothetical protein